MNIEQMAEHDDNTDFEAHHYAKKLTDADFPPNAAETLGKTISDAVNAARRRWEEQVKYVDTENLIRILEDYAKRQEDFIERTAAEIIKAAVNKENFTEAVRAFRTQFATKEDLAAAIEHLESAVKRQGEATAKEARDGARDDLEDALKAQSQTISDSINELKVEQSQHHVTQVRWIAGAAITVTIAILGIILGLIRPLIDK